MKKGSRVYDSLKEQVRAVEGEVSGLDSKVRTYEVALRDLETERDNVYVELAQFYLPDMSANTVASTVRSMQANVSSVFNKKLNRIQELDTSIDASRQQRVTLEETLSGVDKQVRVLERENDRLVGVVNDELKTNPTYVQFKAETEIAKQKLEKDKKRLAEVKAESEEKLIAYEHNPLFRYLNGKDFDSKTKSTGLVEKLDMWVANIVHFKEQKRNYDFLTNAPKVMEEVLSESETKLELALREMENMELRIEQQSGLPEIISQGKAQTAQRKNLLTRLSDVEDKYKEQLQERTKLEDKRGEYWGEAIEKIKTYLKSADISELMKTARSTQSTKDDDLVTRLDGLKRKIKATDLEYQTYLSERNTVQGKLTGLKTVYRKFTDKDYESSRSQFPESFDIEDILIGYIAGRIDSNQVWRDIDSAQVFKPQETYGSTGYRRETSNYGSSSSSRSRSNDDDSPSIITPSWGGGYSSSSSSSSSSSDYGSSSSSSDSYSSGGGDSGGSFSSGSDSF